MPKKQVKIYFIAGEPSGDLLASRLMHALRESLGSGVRFYGVGGETMAEEGLTSLFDISDLSIMGFFEVFKSLPIVLKRMHQIWDDIAKVQPDIVITVDSWSFSQRIHAGMKKRHLNMPHIHYVAPQVWAWKAKRAKTIKKWIDHLLVLLPFERPLFTKHGMPCTYVGHSVIESGADKGKKERFFKAHLQVNSKSFVVTVLPGSRKTELKYLLPIFEQVVVRLHKKHPSLVVVMPTVQTVAERLKQAVSSWKVPVIIIQGRQARYDAFAANRLAIAASGTVSLELAMARVPHLIAYKLNRLTGFLARRLLKIKYVNLINILADAPVIPECLQENCTPDYILAQVKKLSGPAGKTQLNRVQKELKKLGKSTQPSKKAADKVLEILNGR